MLVSRMQCPPAFEGVGTAASQPVQMACLFTHRRHQDPKTRLFMDFMTEKVGKAVKGAERQVRLRR